MGAAALRQVAVIAVMRMRSAPAGRATSTTSIDAYGGGLTAAQQSQPDALAVVDRWSPGPPSGEPSDHDT